MRDLKRYTFLSAIAVVLAASSCAEVDQAAVAPAPVENAVVAAVDAAAPQETVAPQEVDVGANQAAVSTFEEFKRLANLGDAAAQYELAHAYDIGVGVERDARAARTWYLRSAAGGNREAQYKAGLLYEGGYTVPKDIAEALSWYRRAESQGHQLAGRRVPELEKALKTASSVVIANARTAEIQPAVSLYEQGDYAAAHQEFSRLAARNNGGAQYYLGLMYDQGLGVTENPDLARNWYVLAARNGYADAQYKVGSMNEFGHLVLRDPNAALIWYRESASQGHRLAARRVEELERKMATTLAGGVSAKLSTLAHAPPITDPSGAPMAVSVADDASSSVEPAESSGQPASVPALQQTAGSATLVADVQAALAAYNRDDNVGLIEKTRSLAERGDPEAQYQLGTMYAAGNGTDQDDAKAARWYRRAADHGVANAQYALGLFYSEGRGVLKDTAEALKLYRSAAQLGLVEAQNKVDQMVILAASQENESEATNNVAEPISPQQKQVEETLPTFTQPLKEYRIGAGDRLAMTVFGHEDLSGEFLVDGSGRVSLPLLGQVNANDKTIAEFQTEVTTALDRDFIVNPRVSVEVINYRPFFILGQVNNPGSYSYIEGMTARMAVALAGGFTRRARESTVVVVRANDPAQKRTDVGLETSVLPGDTIEVERRLF